jgi:hypothetical protein
MHYSEVTPNNTWQRVITWQDLLDPTSETPCGQSELWIPPTGVSDASDLDNQIASSGLCVFIVCHDNCDVRGLHGKYYSTDTIIWDGMFSLARFKTVPPQYGIYYTP